MDSDDDHGSDEPRFTSGGIFAGSRHFIVQGGTFTNTTKNYVTAPSIPSDFRMIPWGDIDLQRELRVNKESGAIGYRHELSCVRRVYSAKVDGRTTDMTVAVYEGDGADEDWRGDVARYMSMHHPNIIQICAGATHGNIHATVFHGDLIPFKQYVSAFSPMVTVYLYALFGKEWEEARHYLRSAFLTGMRQNIPNYLRNEDSEEEEVDVSSCQCTIWIRSSTGRLSAELALPHRDNETSLAGRGTVELRGPTSYDPSNLEAIAIHALSLGDYHTISCFHFTRSRFTYISTAASVTPGVVVYWPRLDRAHYHDGGEIASLPELYHYPGAWLLYPNPQVEESWLRGNLLENGWMRFSANDSFNKKITLCVDAWLALECLLTQANYIFSSMHIESNLENYGFVKAVYFRVVVPQLTVDCPPGYLFLCPPQDFQVGTSSFKWPDSPAYWSLDPLGHERLSTGEATRLGFPSLELATSVHGVFWDTSVYAGLRQFYRAKGFDAESQDVAEHLGHPLFRLSAELKSPSTHVGKYRNWGSNNGGDDWDKKDEDEENSRWDNSVSVDERDDRNTTCRTNEEELASGAAEVCCDPALDEQYGPHNANTEPRSTSLAVADSAGMCHIRDANLQPVLHFTNEDVRGISLTFKILMNMQLTLMLFLAIWWVRDNLH